MKFFPQKFLHPIRFRQASEPNCLIVRRDLYSRFPMKMKLLTSWFSMKAIGERYSKNGGSDSEISKLTFAHSRCFRCRSSFHENSRISFASIHPVLWIGWSELSQDQVFSKNDLT